MRLTPQPPTTDELAELLATVAAGAHDHYYSRLLPAVRNRGFPAGVEEQLQASVGWLARGAGAGESFITGGATGPDTVAEILGCLRRASLLGIDCVSSPLVDEWLEGDDVAAYWVGVATSAYVVPPENRLDDGDYPAHFRGLLADDCHALRHDTQRPSLDEGVMLVCSELVYAFDRVEAGWVPSGDQVLLLEQIQRAPTLCDAVRIWRADEARRYRRYRRPVPGAEHRGDSGARPRARGRRSRSARSRACASDDGSGSVPPPSHRRRHRGRR